MRAASVLLLCSAPASAREAPPVGGRAALSVGPRGEAEPGHASRADAIEGSASSTRSSAGQDLGNRSAAQWQLPSNRSSFLDIEELALVRGACGFMDKQSAKLLAGVLGACLVVVLCVIVMWVLGGAESPGDAKRKQAAPGVPPERKHLQAQQAMGPPQSPGQLRPVPYPGAPQAPPFAPGPNPAWWGPGPPGAPGQAVQYLPPASPASGGMKDESALFDTYEYRRSSQADAYR